MGSINAKKVAQKVLEKAGKGEKVSVSAIAREVGYGPGTAKNPQQITETKSYQAEIMPFVKKLEKERDRIVLEMSIKDLDKVQYQHLTSAVDTLTKNIQLLSGKETEKKGVTINVVSYGDNDSV